MVPAGDGAHLLEFGETRPDNRSLKAELEFPIEAELDDTSPYDRVHFNDTVTTCGFCHQGEERDEAIASPLAFVSPALKPRPEQRVLLAELAREVQACEESPAAEPNPPADAGADAGVTEAERCEMLHALFDSSRADRARVPDGHQDVLLRLF